jgi:NTE family protein
MKSIGIVLSGGGARGAAHLGVLKALEELRIHVAAISGVSAGAVIGALYAAGVPVEKILDVLKQQSYFGIKDFTWWKNGFFSMATLRRKLDELIGADDFACLRVPLYINATDFNTGCLVTFSQGHLYDAILGSATVPVVFEPTKYNDYLLLDGGMLNNLPVEPLIGKCDHIIGSHVNKLHDADTPFRLDKLSLIDQCFHMVIAQSVKDRAKLCSVFINPLLAGFGMFEMKHADQIFEIGYKAAMEQRDHLEALTA